LENVHADDVEIANAVHVIAMHHLSVLRNDESKVLVQPSLRQVGVPWQGIRCRTVC
jgi:hypothetical protein